MRLIVAIAAAWLLGSGPAAAASSWTEYTFPEDGFAIQFPAPPAKAAGRYQSTEFDSLPATVYSAEAGDIQYRVTVVNLAGRAVEGASFVSGAGYVLMREGDVVFHDFPRVGLRGDAVYGTGMVVDTPDGRRLRTSFYFTKGRFYRVDAVILPARGDLDQAVPARFDQTLRFDVP